MLLKLVIVAFYKRVLKSSYYEAHRRISIIARAIIARAQNCVFSWQVFEYKIYKRDKKGNNSEIYTTQMLYKNPYLLELIAPRLYGNIAL